MSITTYNDLKTTIWAWMGRPSDILIPIDDCITLFESDASRSLRSHFNEAVYYITTALGQDTYSLPTDLVALREVRNTSINLNTLIDFMPPQQLDDMWAFTQIRIPCHYTVEGSNIRFAPSPAAGYVIKLTYWATIPSIISYAASSVVDIINSGSSYTAGDVLTVVGGSTVDGILTVANTYAASAVAISNAGTGYSVNDVLVIGGGATTNGAFTIATFLTVDTVDTSGTITALHISTPGSYMILPDNPVTALGGTGTGATFNLTFVSNRSSRSVITVGTVSSGHITSATVTSAGSYQVPPDNPVILSGGTGSGASFNLTYEHVGGVNWLLDNYPNAYLYGCLANANLYLGGDGMDVKFQTYSKLRDDQFAEINTHGMKYRVSGPLAMRITGMFP